MQPVNARAPKGKCRTKIRQQGKCKTKKNKHYKKQKTGQKRDNIRQDKAGTVIALVSLGDGDC